MKRKPLGRSGIEVSEICLGSMTWGTQNDDAEAFAQIDAAIEAGVNFIDTAELYPTTPLSAETQGETERIIGRWLKARGNRNGIVIASKATGPGRPYIRNGRALDGAGVREAAEGCLKRLGTDHIDLFQIHWPNRGHYHFRAAWSYNPWKQPSRDEIRDNMLDILTALDDLQKAGKIRAAGLSNETAWGMMQYLDLAERHGLPRMASVQNEYNLLYRPHDLDHNEITRHEDIGLLAYSPLAAGLLSGKYLDGAVPAGSRGSLNPDLGGRRQPHQEPAVRAYADIARQAGLAPATLAIAWCLTRPFMTSVIIGATTMAQLADNLAASRTVLDPSVMRQIGQVIRQYPMPI